MLLCTDLYLRYYSFFLLFGTLFGILVNTFLNYKTLVCFDKGTLLLSNALLSFVSTFCLGFIFTYVASGFRQYGFSSIGGFLGMLLSYLVISRLIAISNRDKLLLNFVLVIPLIYSLTKLGCHFGSCCYGIEYDGFFSIIYTGSSAEQTGAVGSRFPVQITETLSFGVVFLIFLLIRLCSRIKPITQAVSLCIVCSLLKFSLDFLRYRDNNVFFSVNQLFCIAIIIVAIVVQVRSVRKLKLSFETI